VRRRDADLAAPARLAAVARVVGEENLSTFNANAFAEELFGDAVFANMILLGFAWQKGLAPVSLDALQRAIALNGVEIERNVEAFAAGRLAAAQPDFAAANPEKQPVETLDEIIARRAAFLVDYQDAAWAGRYRSTVDRMRVAEQAQGSEALTEAVARALFKLMSYKDEYEVARLHMETGFLDELRRNFDGDYTVNYHLAPPFLASGRDARGRPHKRRFGPWIQTPFRLLARLKGLRGTALDVFGYSAERRMERELIGWYESLTDVMIARLREEQPQTLLALARAPLEIRGFGPVKEKAVKEVKAEVARLSHPAERPSDQRAA
jgi:indolepyruvate ferredoxin oxidoreductase